MRQTALLRSIVDFHDESTLAAGLIAVSDGVRRRLRGERVSIGLRDRDAMTVAAISQQAVVDSDAPETRLLADVLAEACRRGEQIRVVADASDEAADPDTLPAHRAFLAGRPGLTLVTTPLCHRETVIGALLVESVPGVPWNRARLELVRCIADTLAPMIADRRAAERSLARRAADGTRDALAALRAPRHLLAKIGAATLGLAVLGLVLVPFEQRVTASAELVPTSLRTVTAPMTGYIARVAVAAGDTVRRDQVLFELDTRDLLLERDRWRSELDGIAVELRAVRAAGDRKQAAVARARREQAAAELALVEQRLARATVRAPHDGRVLSGDLARMSGAAVERGQRLVELAPEGGYKVGLLVDERDIALLSPGQRGTLTLQARPGERLAFELGVIHPIALARDGRNRFRVDAVPDTTPGALLPGQTGVGKVQVGEASAWRIVTRRFDDWLRLQLWTWFGR